MPLSIGAKLALFFYRGASLPFSDDFERADGVLGNDWTAPNFLIVSGKAVGTPTVGSEVLADPGLEATYTAGLCATINLSGTPTMVQSADAHGGSNAQQMTATAQNNDAYYAPRPTPVNGQWYIARLWAKQTAGSGNNSRALLASSQMKPVTTLSRAIATAGYAELVQIFRTDGTGVITFGVRDFGASAFCTVIFDDGSLKPLTMATLFAFRPPTQANVIVRVGMNLTEGICGVIVRSDSATNPQNFIIAWLHRTNIFYYVILEKCVNGVYSTVIAQTIFSTYTTSYVADKLLEIRCNGSTVSLWYDGTQVSTDAMVSDATILNNTIHGVMSGGGSGVTRFFLDSN